MTAEQYVAMCERKGRRVRRIGPSRWMVQCAGHDDNGPSLQVKVGNTQPLMLHCYAGCPNDQVLAADGLSWREVLPDGRPVMRLPERLSSTDDKRPPNGSSTGDPLAADELLELWRAADLPYRCCEQLGQWRAVCPRCGDDDGWSVWIREFAGRPDDTAVWCAHGCDEQQIRQALKAVAA